ncbi:MAG TPA: ribonuclease Z [Actinomycetota bacterium]|nr:ribonuclease Z [Actinomycetota bacterium]
MRELVVLGTAGQVPTRDRNVNGYLLRWDDEALLFDPGEGTQRQMLLAGVKATSITRIFLTHFHGDHCLGLPGVVQRLALDGVSRPVQLYYHATGHGYLERLLGSSAHFNRAPLDLHAVQDPGLVHAEPPFSVFAGRLEHNVPVWGWRIEEPDGRRILPERLTSLGIEGPSIGELQRGGSISVQGRTVTLDEASEVRPGQRFAFLMDTRICGAAVDLARDADMLVTECTYLSDQNDLAARYGHLTAAHAARIASEAGVRLLVLTHFSQRYPDTAPLLAEARAIFPNTVAAADLVTIPVPPRR